MLLIRIAVQFAKLLANYAGIIHMGKKSFIRQQCAVCNRGISHVGLYITTTNEILGTKIGQFENRRYC